MILSLSCFYKHTCYSCIHVLYYCISSFTNQMYCSFSNKWTGGRWKVKSDVVYLWCLIYITCTSLVYVHAFFRLFNDRWDLQVSANQNTCSIRFLKYILIYDLSLYLVVRNKISALHAWMSCIVMDGTWAYWLS